MRALLVFAHYFKAEEKSIYSSTNAAMQELRKKNLERVLLGWRGCFSESSVLDIEHKHFVPNGDMKCAMDIKILTHDDNHLLDAELMRRYGVQKVNVRANNPRFLPFAAHRLMADNEGKYDWFVYSEDDLLVSDPYFFAKLQKFQDCFGMYRTLNPHRFEMNPAAFRFKTYIDGNLRAKFIDGFLGMREETSPLLEQDFDFGKVRFVRARNPHSGFFALSDEQVAYWKRQPSFQDLDCSFVSPLESAATLSILKSFSIYKAEAPAMSYFDVEHLDNKFSGMRLPVAPSSGA